ncbi:DUF4192 family protein [Arthrobacter sp. JCM 19049]|uniref:DUF4192 family protein n=1 Tax=Arthrobacter sp. JCM 19049 TaxID=1460643 RepID=UPI0024372F31|nr:DUF4192 family protein [Arthrobacter sp. JCM 19049]
MTTTPEQGPLSLERAEDILAYVPHALGFHPSDSAVLLLMVDKKLEATLRVDLPKHDSAGERRPWVEQVCKLVGKLPQLTGALCVLYSNDPPPAGRELPYHQLLAELSESFDARRTPLHQAWFVNRGMVWNYNGAVPEQRENRPARNSATLTSEWSWPVPPHCTSLGRGGRPGMGERRNDPQPRRFARRRHVRLPGYLAALLETDAYQSEATMRSEPLVAARLLSGLEIRLVRDILPYLAGVGAVAARTAVRELALRETEERAQELADFLLGGGANTPEWKRLENLWFICRDLLGVARAGQRSALLCILAWIEWAKGRGSMSMALLRTALDSDPEYRLAQLLQQLLYRGIMPEWATDPQRAWRSSFH